MSLGAMRRMAVAPRPALRARPRAGRSLACTTCQHEPDEHRHRPVPEPRLSARAQARVRGHVVQARTIGLSPAKEEDGATRGKTEQHAQEQQQPLRSALRICLGAGVLVAMGVMAVPAVTHASSGHAKVAAAYSVEAVTSHNPGWRLATLVKQSGIRWMLWNEHAPVKIIEAVVITLSTILVGSLLAFRLQQIYNKNKMMTFTETIWWTWSNIVASSNHTKQTEWPMRLLSIGLFFCGIATYTIAIGTVTSEIKQRLELVAKGIHSRPVGSTGHTLVSGYNSQVPPMVKHLKQVGGAMGGRYGGTVLVSEPKNFQWERTETLNEGIAPLLLHRRGKLFDPTTYENANANKDGCLGCTSTQSSSVSWDVGLLRQAARLVLMASGQDRNEANAQAVLSVLALKNTIVDFPGVAVVQVADKNTAELVRSLGGPKVEPLLDHSPSIFLHCGRFPGLSDVFRKLLSTSGSSRLLLLPLPSLDGRVMSLGQAKARLAAAGSTACGVLRADTTAAEGRRQTLWADSQAALEYNLQEDDLLIAVGAPRLDVWRRSLATPVAAVAAPQKAAKRRSARCADEHMLILGWRPSVAEMLIELDRQCGDTKHARGSKVKVVVLSQASVEEREEYLNRLKRTRGVSLKHLDVTHLRGSTISYSTMADTIRDHFKEVARKTCDRMSVMVVSENTMARKGDDKNSIYTLLMAEKMLASQGIHKAHLLAEVVDPKIADAVRQIHPSINTVALNEIMSLVLAGVVEERNLNVVWEELTSSEGSEIYAKPAELYMRTPKGSMEETASIRMLSERALECGGVLIGYRRADSSVVVNPDEYEQVTLTAAGDSSAPNAVTQLMVVSATADGTA